MSFTKDDSSMRLVFDLQEAQTENQYRSSGRYSLLLAKALARCKTEHELFLLLNASFPDAVESIRAQFDGLLPQDNIRVFDIPSPAQENKRSNEWRRKAAELLCESYINSLYPDAVYISNIFTGWADNAVISLDAFPSSIPHIVGVHSLPDYQDTCEQESEYGAFLQRREGCLQHTDLILTTSVSIQSRLQERLSIDGKKIKLTPPSISPSFKPSPSTQQDGIVLCERYNLKSPFLLYVGNANASSEATTLCKAFSELSGRERTTFSLVFIGLSFKEETEVKNQSNALGITESVFTIKHLPVDDLIRFYNTSYLSIFPEQDKAAVFPLLEAMSCGAPILVANSPLARGLIESESVFFEPRTPQRLAQLIKRYISDNALRDALKEEALSRSQSFSLDRSALDVWKKIEDLCFFLSVQCNWSFFAYFRDGKSRQQ